MRNIGHLNQNIQNGDDIDHRIIQVCTYVAILSYTLLLSYTNAKQVSQDNRLQMAELFIQILLIEIGCIIKIIGLE